jgi:uncharacterized protein (DUF58 family)
MENRRKPKYLDPAILKKMGSLELVAREVVEGIRIGVHKSPVTGFSTEFSHRRAYSPGDDLRHMDWKVYARTDRYYVKLFEAETDFAAHLLLDASSSMSYGSNSVTKLEYASFLAASLAYLIVNQNDAVGLAIFDNELRRYIEPRSSMSIVHNIAEELEKDEHNPRTNVAALLHEFAQRISRRGFVLLFSDLFDQVDDFLKGLDHLRFEGHNVAVFHILDPYELEFPFGSTCRFEGLENEGDIITQPSRIRRAYLQELTSFLNQVKAGCNRSRVDYILVDTSRPVDVVLSAYLIKRARNNPIGTFTK